MPEVIKSDILLSRYQESVESSLLFREVTGNIDVAMAGSIFKKMEILYVINRYPVYSKPPVVMAGRRPAMTTAVGRRPTAGWLFKKTAIWRCEIVMESDRVSYLKVSRGYMVLSMILDLHVHFP